jgi:transposase
VKRAAFREQIATAAPEDLVFVDETGANVRLTRLYARAPRGERAVGRVPRNHGTSTTLVAALTPDGLEAPRQHLGAMTTARFVDYVRDVLCPTLRPGQVVVLDNLSAHTSAAVRTLIEAADCTLLYLPAYSPDYAPIELAYAKVKATLRRLGARTQEALTTAIDTAVATVSAQDARAFFAHCGYSLAQPT